MPMPISSIKLLGGDALMKAAAVAVGVMFRRCTLVLPLFHYLCHFHTKRAKGKQGIGRGEGEGRRGSRLLPNENIGSRTAGGERLKNRGTADQSIDRYRFRLAFATELGGESLGQN